MAVEGGGRERERLLASLGRRIAAYLRDGDARSVVAAAAEAEARALLEIVRNSPADGDVQMMVGHLYWWRHDAMRGHHPGAEGARRSALAHLSAVYDDGGELIPPEARAELDRIQERKTRASDLLDLAPTRRDTGALDEAIEIIRDLVETLGDEDPTLPIPLSELAVALDWRFKTTGRAADVAEALAVIDRAIGLTHPADEEGARRENLRKLILVTRYDHGRDLADLDEAIALGHTLLDASAPDDPDRASMVVDFPGLYLRRYRHTQTVADLDAGVRFGRQGLAMLEANSRSPEAASLSDDLAVLLRYRGMRTGSTADLDEAVALGRRAVAEFPTDHADWIVHLNGLSESLRRAGAAHRSAALLREAIQVADEVVRVAVVRRHPAVGGFRQVVGVSYLELHAVEPDASHLMHAVAHLREALAGPDLGPDLAAARSDLATALHTLAEYTGDAGSLDQAVALHEEALGDRLDDPATAQSRINFGAALRTRHDRAGSAKDRARAVTLFRSVAVQDAVAPRLRLIGARSWGMLEADAGNGEAASHALSLAVELLTRISAPHLARSDQERQLMSEPGLVAEAVAAAVEIGELDRAVELFEQGRGVLTAHALDLRTDVGRLAAHDPVRAEAFVRLRDSLDGDDSDANVDPDSRHRWAGEWHELLREIRALPGFTDFLLPMTAAQIRAAASAGPIVMVNVADRRSDALVVRPDRITLVPLPLQRPSMEANVLTFVATRDMLFGAALTDAQIDRANDRITEALLWTWQAVTGPVLEDLGIRQPHKPGTRRPRIWWMPSSLLNFLPLHAARNADRTDGPTSVLDVLVSSYTPTVRSLVEARQRTTRSVQGTGPLVVAMEHTPGARDLPGAAREAQFIYEEVPGTVCLVDEAATRDVVCETMGRHAWVHFCCHGHSDRTDPSASHLLVSRGARLTLWEISRLRIAGELAYLSACSTGSSGLALVDESLHLAGAFQLAGYQHVVAAMWPIADRIAVRIARRVYTLVAPGSRSVDQLSAILHDAILQVRSAHPDRPALWASFIHIGP